jgi:diaminopimelate decarboxylase
MTEISSTNLPPFFQYREGWLYLEDLALEEVATRFGTPSYVYSASALRKAYRRYTESFTQSGLNLNVCYALKANSNLNIIRLFGEMGAGADVVSGGELYRVRQAGVAPEKIVFAGVGKTVAEIDFALEQNIGAFNVESAPELNLIEHRAHTSGKSARVSLRVNPDVDAETHPYITTGKHQNKFGSSLATTKKLAHYAKNSASLQLVGLQMHIGSQLLQVRPVVESFRRLLALAEELEAEGIKIEHLDLGGGLGVTYNAEQPEQPDQLAQAIASVLREHSALDKYRLSAEPGRYLTANAGVLLTNILYVKQEDPESLRFAIVDAGMNDLIRPALYSAKHRIVPLHESGERESYVYEVVGPVCESADFFAHNLTLPELREGEAVALLSAGAYGFSMASNYNSRPRPPEILVEGSEARLIRRRETYQDLIALEKI